jgi:hypothetical protein
MRRVGELLKDLGFNPDAPLETQKAFVRHLVRAANLTSAQNSSQTLELPTPKEPVRGEQLSFDPAVLGIVPQESVKKKASG